MINVESTYGAVRGTRRQDVCVFSGIPYARPPVDALRFQPPQPPVSWSSTRDATPRLTPAAPQNPDLLDHIWGEVLAPGNEDCLTLNVWTPEVDVGRRPVMVCIHGGAFVIGSGRWPWYEGSGLVRRGDVVLVTLNYRLGAFGFLDLSEIGGEARPEERQPWPARPDCRLAVGSRQYRAIRWRPAEGDTFRRVCGGHQHQLPDGDAGRPRPLPPCDHHERWPEPRPLSENLTGGGPSVPEGGQDEECRPVPRTSHESPAEGPETVLEIE